MGISIEEHDHEERMNRLVSVDAKILDLHMHTYFNHTSIVSSDVLFRGGV